MELTTERCIIRNMKMKDADDLYQVLSDASVMMYIEQVFDIEKTRCFIQSAGLCEPPLVYAIVWKMTGEVIGHAIFHSYEKNDYEIGWVLNKNYWGIGIADEVTRELIKCARYLGIDFTSLPTVRLVSGQSLNHAKSLLMGDSQFSALKVTDVRSVQYSKAS